MNYLHNLHVFSQHMIVNVTVSLTLSCQRADCICVFHCNSVSRYLAFPFYRFMFSIAALLHVYFKAHIVLKSRSTHNSRNQKYCSTHETKESDRTKTQTSSNKKQTLLLLLFESLLDLLWFVKLNQTEDVLIAHNSLNELALCYFT